MIIDLFFCFAICFKHKDAIDNKWSKAPKSKEQEYWVGVLEISHKEGQEHRYSSSKNPVNECWNGNKLCTHNLWYVQIS